MELLGPLLLCSFTDEHVASTLSLLKLHNVLAMCWRVSKVLETCYREQGAGNVLKVEQSSSNVLVEQCASTLLKQK